MYLSEFMDTNDENCNDISHDLEILKQKLNSQQTTPVRYLPQARPGQPAQPPVESATLTLLS